MRDKLSSLYPLLVKRASTIMSCSHDASDVVQESLLHLLLSEVNIVSIRNLTGYLMTCIANRARSRIRSRRRSHSHVVALPNSLATQRAADDPVEASIAAEQKKALDELIGSLSEPQQRLYAELRTGSSSTSRSVAGMIGCSHTNALSLRKRLQRVLSVVLAHDSSD